MKGFILTILCICTAGPLIGQTPFAPIGAKYYYKSVDMFMGQTAYWHFTVEKDTIIQGKYCTLHEETFSASCSDSHTYYVHQNNDEVYVYDEDEQTFQLIYDFSKPAGTSWRLKVCENYWGTDSVTVSILVNDGDTMRMSVMSDAFGGAMENMEIRKGIGGVNGNRLLFEPINEPFLTYLLCYDSPNTGLVQIAGGSCVGPTSTNGINKDMAFSISPNPAIRLAQLSFGQPLEHPATWQLYDHLGREAMKMTLGAGQQVAAVSVADLPSGLYFWCMASEGRQVGNGKLVVLKD